MPPMSVINTFSHASPKSPVQWLDPGILFFSVLKTVFSLIYTQDCEEIKHMDSFSMDNKENCIRAAKPGGENGLVG